MMIKEVFPQAVEKTGSLRALLLLELEKLAMSSDKIEDFLNSIPVNLLTAKCFFDKITGLWKYEFGSPGNLPQTKKLLWGTMWNPVNTLFKTMHCAYSRLSQKELQIYLRKLSNSDKHLDVLVEMLPALKIDQEIQIDFEVKGYGPIGSDIDWKINLNDGRSILFEVKNRIKDLYEMMDKESVDQPPEHDPSILFRSLEKKFFSANPDQFLQGVFIVTYVSQEKTKLSDAFAQLDHSKVHFAIITNHEATEALFLTRRDEDEVLLKNVLGLKSSDRLTFSDS
jgi:hypothetical protein